MKKTDLIIYQKCNNSVKNGALKMVCALVTIFESNGYLNNAWHPRGGFALLSPNSKITHLINKAFFWKIKNKEYHVTGWRGVRASDTKLHMGKGGVKKGLLLFWCHISISRSKIYCHLPLVRRRFGLRERRRHWCSDHWHMLRPRSPFKQKIHFEVNFILKY